MTTDTQLIRLPREAWPTIDELPDGDMRQLAEEVGMEKLMSLYAQFRSTSIYFGGLDKLLRRHRDNLIRKDFDRLTTDRSARKAVKELARKFDLSDRWVWELVGRPDEQ